MEEGRVKRRRELGENAWRGFLEVTRNLECSSDEPRTGRCDESTQIRRVHCLGTVVLRWLRKGEVVCIVYESTTLKTGKERTFLFQDRIVTTDDYKRSQCLLTSRRFSNEILIFF